MVLSTVAFGKTIPYQSQKNLECFEGRAAQIHNEKTYSTATRYA